MMSYKISPYPFWSPQQNIHEISLPYFSICRIIWSWFIQMINILEQRIMIVKKYKNQAWTIDIKYMLIKTYILVRSMLMEWKTTKYQNN